MGSEFPRRKEIPNLMKRTRCGPGGFRVFPGIKRIGFRCFIFYLVCFTGLFAIRARVSICSKTRFPKAYLYTPESIMIS